MSAEQASYLRTLSLRLPASTIASMRRAAQLHGITLSEYVGGLFAAYGDELAVADKPAPLKKYSDSEIYEMFSRSGMSCISIASVTKRPYAEICRVIGNLSAIDWKKDDLGRRLMVVAA